MDSSKDYIIAYMYYASDIGPRYYTQIFCFDDNFNFKLKMTLPSYERQLSRINYLRKLTVDAPLVVREVHENILVLLCFL